MLFLALVLSRFGFFLALAAVLQGHIQWFPALDACEWGVLWGARSPQLATTLPHPLYSHVVTTDPRPQADFAVSGLLTLQTSFAPHEAFSSTDLRQSKLSPALDFGSSLVFSSTLLLASAPSLTTTVLDSWCGFLQHWALPDYTSGSWLHNGMTL